MRSLTFQQIGKWLKSSFRKITDLSTNDKGIASKPDFKKACQIYNYIDNHPELKYILCNPLLQRFTSIFPQQQIATIKFHWKFFV